MSKLADRIEALDGPDWDTAMQVVEFCYERGIPIKSYGGPINYDPALWQERHGFDPTANLDAAMTLLPDGWRVNIDISEDGISSVVLDGRETVASTPALALCAAALRAHEQENGDG